MRWLLMVALALPFFFVLTALPGAAETSGPCQATVAGIAVDDRDPGDPADAIHVDPDQPVAFAFTADGQIRSWDASVEYWRFQAPLSRGEAQLNESRAAGEIPVQDFAWMGVGLYRLSGQVELSDGSTCTGEVLIDIDGDPLGTVLGSGSLVVASAGAVGLVASGVSGFQAARSPTPPADEA